MLPVSGAAQFSAAGARWGLRPVISASGAYWRLVRPGAVLAGQEEVPQAALAGLGAQLAEDGAESQAHGSSSCASCSSKTGSAG